MKYGDFISEFIQLLKSWGTWKDSVRILCDGQVFSPDIWENSLSDCDFEKVEGCEIFVDLNSVLIGLFEYGILEAELEDLPLARKRKLFWERKELQEAFEEENDEEDVRIHPEEFGIPSELEFDSADEYEAFLETELDKVKDDFIANMTGTVELGNDLETEIGELCIRHGLSYKFEDCVLYIGHGFINNSS